MAKKLYIHIGIPKTGSSALQAFLGLNQDYIAKNFNYAYPWHAGFNQAYQTSAGNAPELAQWITKDNYNVFKAKIEKIKEDNIILSSEILFHTCRLQPKQFASFFSEYDFKIICYIRKIDDFIDSVINQLIKNHDLIDHTELTKIMKAHDYADVLLNLEKYIDKEKIDIRFYKNNSYLGGNIYNDFFDALDLNFDKFDKTQLIYPEAILNPSLNRNALEFRKILNRIEFNKFGNVYKNSINGILAKYSVDHPNMQREILTQEQRYFLIQNYKEKEVTLNKYFFDNSERIFSYADVIHNSSIPFSFTYEDALEILEFIFKEVQETFFKILKLFETHMENEDFFSTLLKNFCLKNIFNETKHIDSHFGTILPKLFQKMFTVNHKNFHNVINKKNADVEKMVNSANMTFDLYTRAGNPFIVLEPMKLPKKMTGLFVIIKMESSCHPILKLHYQTTEEALFGNRKFVRAIGKKGIDIIIFCLYDIKLNGTFRIDFGDSQGIFKIKKIEFFTF